jgi:Amt family ammonium transporter
MEQRLADLEAYVNNTARTPDVASKIPGPGPGHNAWQMTSTALVIFMTLPGLALFYGGLVRKKNVLSVLAQCMGIAGLVTILWWAIGYSLAFGAGNAFIGDTAYKFFQGVEPRATPARATTGSATPCGRCSSSASPSSPRRSSSAPSPSA